MGFSPKTEPVFAPLLLKKLSPKFLTTSSFVFFRLYWFLIIFFYFLNAYNLPLFKNKMLEKID